eukprot:1160823-Pelagomonas_calceolata.AAC.5
MALCSAALGAAHIFPHPHPHTHVYLATHQAACTSGLIMALCSAVWGAAHIFPYPHPYTHVHIATHQAARTSDLIMALCSAATGAAHIIPHPYPHTHVYIATHQAARTSGLIMALCSAATGAAHALPTPLSGGGVSAPLAARELSRGDEAVRHLRACLHVCMYVCVCVRALVPLSCMRRVTRKVASTRLSSWLWGEEDASAWHLRIQAGGSHSFLTTCNRSSPAPPCPVGPCT